MDGAALAAVWREAVAACDPAARVQAALGLADVAAALGGADGPVTVVAVGKAAAAMAAGARAWLGPRVAGGLVIVPDGVAIDEAALGGLAVRRAAHPVPDARSEAAGREALAVAGGAQVLLALVSGGASALCAVPRDGVSLAEKVAQVSAASRRGVPIGALNALRSSLSAVKGGRLAAACPGRVVTLVASDVPGDELAVVGSGPTVPGKPGDLARLCAGLAILREAAAAAARARGVAVVARAGDVVGDVAVVAAEVVAAGDALAAGAVWIAGGEWTVSLDGGAGVGVGGRAQALALRLAQAWDGRGDRMVLVAGSDGVDGTGPAAGAIVDGTTWHRIAAAGVDPARALAGHDSGSALAAAGATLVTGPTGVNHADLIVVTCQ